MPASVPVEMKGPQILLDTNVASYILGTSALGEHYARRIVGWDAHVALVTVAEMHFGGHAGHWGPRRWSGLHRLFESMEIVLPSPETARLTGFLVAERRLKGRPLSFNDAWIAATALICGCPLVTHDGDFADIEGLYVISSNSRLCVRDDGIPFGVSRLPRRFRWLEHAA